MFSTIGILLCTLFGVYFLIKLYFTRHANFWAKRGVTLLENDLTLWQFFSGAKSFPDFDVEHYKLLEAKGKKYGGILEMGSPLLLVNDLDIVKQIMVKDFDHFVDHRDFVDSDPLFSKNLFFLHGQDWRDMRGFLSPTFTSGKIKRMFHHFQNGSVRLHNYIEKFHKRSGAGGGYNVVVPDVMGRFTADVIGAVAFGMETDCLSKADSLFYKMAKDSSDFIRPSRLVKFAIFNTFPKFATFLKMEVGDKHTNDFFTNILTQAFKTRESSGQQREDFLQLLIEAKEGRLKDFGRNEENSADPSETKEQAKKPKLQLTTELANAQAFVFFMAGFDTVALLLGAVAYFLATEPEVQEKLFSETEEILSETKDKFTYESANKMHYMEMVISETLRMFPPVGRIERKCIKTCEIGDEGLVIPKGVMVGVPAVGIHYDEKYYENPTKFDPERFTPERKANRNPYTYLPFGTGPRNCIGMRYALIEAKVALAYIVHNFEIRPVPGKTPVPVKLVRKFGFLRLPKELEVELLPRSH